MKKVTIITLAIAKVILFTALIDKIVSAQPVQKTPAIPADVLIIAKKTCMYCHAEPGNKIALFHVNLSKWDTYTIEKQSAKASAMCNMVSNGKMPPKAYKKKNPDFVPTKDEIKTICDWSESLKVTKK
jgi:hypothetical protein